MSPYAELCAFAERSGLRVGLAWHDDHGHLLLRDGRGADLETVILNDLGADELAWGATVFLDRFRPTRCDLPRLPSWLDQDEEAA